jgi:hypothetical protein
MRFPLPEAGKHHGLETEGLADRNTEPLHNGVTAPRAADVGGFRG